MGKYSLQKTPYEIQKELAEKVKTIRRQGKISQANLADRSGVSLGSLKRFETTGKISLESFLKLLHVLNRLDEIENILLPQENMEEIKKLFLGNSKK